MFNTAHILYMVISAVVSAVILTVCYFKVGNLKSKELVLKIFAILTVVLHFSSLYVDFFKGEEPVAGASMLLPIHPCNIIMWLLVIVAFFKNRESTVCKILSEFTFWAGIICGTVGILVNENYANTPTLADYDVLKGLLSHSTMLIGCIYILVGKFIKIRVSNVKSVFFGLCLFIVDGVLINALYSIFGLDPCNSMYLLEPPFDTMPWLNTLVIGIIGLGICFAVTATYEKAFLPLEERWYYKAQETSEEETDKRGI